jgi:DNA-binding beta-propeller fold protein YncE
MTITGRIGVLAGAGLLATGVITPAAAVEPSTPPAATRTVYVTNSDSHKISTFTVDPVTGRPTLSAELTEARVGVRQMAFTADGRHAYTANADENGTLSSYTVAPGGRLTPQRLVIRTGGDTPLGIVVTPRGHTLYVTHVFSNTVTAFPIKADGNLGQPVAHATAVNNPRGLALTPDGRYLYAGHGDPGPDREHSVGAITAFKVGPDGGLTPTGTPIRVGIFCGAISITPDGRRLYMVCQDTDNIFGFAIGSDGGLTPLPGSPYEVSDFPEGITITPDGRNAYVASPGGGGPTGAGPGAVSSFTIGTDGALAELPDSRIPADTFPFPVGITTLPNGRFVYTSGGDATGLLGAFGVGTGPLTTLPDSPFDTSGEGPGYNSASVLPNQGPVAAFAARVAGRPATFDASGSTDPDGTVATYRWDFGDGSTLTTTDPRTTHVYPRAGTFRVSLVVTDNEGCSTTLVTTGQAVLCNGTAAATVTRAVVSR